jgi:hypothetical protein
LTSPAFVIGRRLIGSKPDQRQPRLVVGLASQMRGRFGQDHFEPRPDARFEQVAAVRRPVGFSDDDVRVDFRLALVLISLAAPSRGGCYFGSVRESFGIGGAGFHRARSGVILAEG